MFRVFKIMFFLFLAIVVLGLLLKRFDKPDPVFEKLVKEQDNPFLSAADSSEIIWQRAIRFLELEEAIISAGRPVIRDSVIVVPYASSYDKGSSIRIERKREGDMVRYTCTWWYSRILQEKGGREIALYMQKERWRYETKRP
jgi:hypothetical protein